LRITFVEVSTRQLACTALLYAVTDLQMNNEIDMSVDLLIRLFFKTYAAYSFASLEKSARPFGTS